MNGTTGTRPVILQGAGWGTGLLQARGNQDTDFGIGQTRAVCIPDDCHGVFVAMGLICAFLEVEWTCIGGAHSTAGCQPSQINPAAAACTVVAVVGRHQCNRGSKSWRF